MKNTQEALLRTKGYYSKAVEAVESILSRFEEMEKARGETSGVNIPLVLEGFDIIIQYSLLEVALIRREYNKDDCDFIRSLVGKDAIMHFLNDVNESHRSWDDFNENNYPEFVDYIEHAKEHANETASDLGEVFGTFARLTKYPESFKILRDNIFAILMSVETSEIEIVAVTNSSAMHLINSFEDYLGE